MGPIVRQTDHTRDELRKKFAFDKNTITVSVGGTDAGKFLVEKVLEIAPKLKDYDVVLVSGPTLKIQNTSIRNLGFVNNLHEIIYASDLVISLAGKSTIDEAKAYGTPGIFIPIKGHFEQEDNARSVGYSFEDINTRVTNSTKNRIRALQAQTDGAKKAAQIIHALLN